MRPPVDFDLSLVQSVTPCAQARRRKMQRGGVFWMPMPLQFIASTCIAQYAWTARLRTSVLTAKQPSALFLPLRSLFQAPLTAQFRLIFRMFARRVVARKVLQPAIERVLRQAMHAAIFRPRQTAAPPRLDVNHPIGLPLLVHETSQIHRRSSMQRRSQACRTIALLNLGAEAGRLHTTEGLRPVIGRSLLHLPSPRRTSRCLLRNLLSNNAGGG